jgi:Mg/Co/Ni transporter MgtE
MRYVTISVKIPRELKELMDKYGIKPSIVIRRALEEEVKKRILEEAENKAKELINKVSHISDEEIARIIREDRDGK